MNNLSVQQLESTVSWYQELLVPALFESWTDQVLIEARLNATDRLLDVACGTGVLARAAADQLGAEGYVEGLDMNPGMLEVAKKLNPHIEWHRGVAEDLPWEDHSFDVVVSQFGLMFFEDCQIALREMFRVLKPQGRLVVTVFDSLDHIPGYERITKVFSAVAGEEVAEALRFPFSFGDTDELKSLCSKSEITSAKIKTYKDEAHFSDVRAMVLADVNGWFPLAGITLNEKQIDEVVNRAEIGLKKFIAPDRSVTFPMSAHFIVATKN